MKGRTAIQRQSGLTLIEVLVGFVIFTVSLVAILDYVGAQIFHVHRAKSGLQHLQQIYDRELGARTRLPNQSAAVDDDSRMDWTIDVTELSAVEQKTALHVLNRYRYRSSLDAGGQEWTVVRFELVQ